MTDRVKEKYSVSLYDILDHCSNDELAPIVDSLVGSPFSYLKHARAYLRFQPDHGAYRDQIAEEIYRLGLFLTESFSAQAGSMAGEKHSYDDLIATVCKKIAIPIAGVDVVQHEAMLINMFTKQHLLTADPERRAALVKEAAGAAGKAAASILTTDAWLPFVSTLVEIAYLRGGMVADGRLLGHDSHTLVMRPEPKTAVSVVGDDGRHAFALAAIPEEKTQDWSFMVPDGRTRSQLAPLLTALQPFFSAEQMLSGKNIYSAEAALSWSDKVGGYVGVAKGHKGMVDLHQVTAIGISGPAIFLTAATAIAQQQQMQRIEEALDEIKAMLADISRFQQDERRSTLTGSIRYFKQVARAVLSGELAPEVLHTIEHHEAELNKVYDHLAKDLHVATEALRAVKKDTFGSSKYVKALQDGQTTVMGCYDDILLCLRARACGFQLMSAYPGREAGKQARYEAIAEDLRPFLPTGEATIAIDRILREKLQVVSSYESKASLLARENALLDNLIVADRAITAAIAPAFLLSNHADDCLVLDFQVEAGEIVGIRVG